MPRFNNLTSSTYDRAEVLSEAATNAKMDNYTFQQYANVPMSRNARVEDELGIYKKTSGSFSGVELAEIITKMKQKRDLVDQSAYFVKPPLDLYQPDGQFYNTESSLLTGKLGQNRKEDLALDETRAHIEYPFANYTPMVPRVARSMELRAAADRPATVGTRRVVQAKYARE